MGRPPCCDKMGVKRGLWTAEEDAKILAHVSKHGTGLRRCGKSCRLRWTNYLRPDLKHESFTPQEEELIVRLHATIGSRWAIIAQQLPGRTDNDVKNHWNTKLKKKLSEMGIDPITHKPFSQILADYGNINGVLPKNGTRIGSLTRDLKNAFMSKPEADAQEIFMTHHRNLHDNPSMHLLNQLKSIKLVTEASRTFAHHENITSNFLGEVSSLSSPTSFTWHEFLIEDPQEQENMPEFSSKIETNIADGKGKQKEENPIQEMAADTVRTINGGGTSEASSSSCDSSFLDAMLDRENDMFLEFPALLEEPFYYY